MTEQMNDEAFFVSFQAMQAELPIITKNTTNPQFKSKFADLATIVTTVRPILSKHGFVLIQQPGFRMGTGDPTLSTILRHKSGVEIRSEMLLLLVKSDPQGQGSALTYARRYALSTILGIVTDEDDDGNAASAPITQSHTVRREAPERPVAPRIIPAAATTALEDF